MATPTVTIFALLLSLLWKVLIDTPFYAKNTLYDRFLTSLPIIQDIASAANLSFAPGLLDVVQSTVPPTIDFFKRLPYDNIRNIWSIYALVLEKAGCRAKLYIGSATNSKVGTFLRWDQYDKNIVLPRWVEDAMNQGFEITHKGLICWSPIPDAKYVPLYRLFFLALECTFAFIFWVMKAQKADYGVSHICPWNWLNMPYDGLCSHQCLYESPRGDFDMTEVQLEAQAVESERKFRELKAINATNYHHKQMAENYDEYITNANARVYKSKATNPEKHRATERKRIAKDVKAKKHYCSICDRSFTREKALGEHLAPRRHKDMADKNFEFFCVPCNLGFYSASGYSTHHSSERHAKSIAALAGDDEEDEDATMLANDDEKEVAMLAGDDEEAEEASSDELS